MNNLKNRLGNIKWVLSGSQAMKLYANKYGVETRTPQNINIVVRRNNMAKAYTALSGQRTPNRMNKNHYKVSNLYNLLRANTNLAPSINKYEVINGIPVVLLNKLLNQKRKTLNNFPQKNRIPIIEKNIETILKIMNKRNNNRKRKRESPKRVLNRSPPQTAVRARTAAARPLFDDFNN